MMKLRDKSLKVFRFSRKDEDWNVCKQNLTMLFATN